MKARTLRRSAASAQRFIPASGDLTEFVEALARSRGRPTVLLGVAFDAEAPSGVWIVTDKRDYIAYPNDASAARKAAIVCHEVAHMLLGHDPPPGTEGLLSLAASAAPTLDPAVAIRLLARHCYASEQEADAEGLGTRLAAELARRERLARAPRDRVYDRMR